MATQTQQGPLPGRCWPAGAAISAGGHAWVAGRWQHRDGARSITHDRPSRAAGACVPAHAARDARGFVALQRRAQPLRDLGRLAACHAHQAHGLPAAATWFGLARRSVTDLMQFT